MLHRTAQFEPARPFELTRARGRQRLLAVDREMDGSQPTPHSTHAQFKRHLSRRSENGRRTSGHVAHALGASDNEADGFAGKSPAT